MARCSLAQRCGQLPLWLSAQHLDGPTYLLACPHPQPGADRVRLPDRHGPVPAARRPPGGVLSPPRLGALHRPAGAREDARAHDRRLAAAGNGDRAPRPRRPRVPSDAESGDRRGLPRRAQARVWGRPVGAAGLSDRLSAPDLETDVAVVGGGPAGAAAAATAHAAGLEVCLLVGRPRHVPAGQSLPPGTDRIVAQLFGPAALRPDEHRRAYGNRSAWGGEALDSADFMFDPLGPGWHLDRRAFDAGLIDAARERGVQVVAAQLRRAQRRGSTWELGAHTANGPLRVRGRFVIDAGGRTPPLPPAARARR